MSYDNAGNLTNDTYTGAGSRTYDAENRMLTAADNMSQTSQYTYNADGRRTRRQIPGNQEQWQIYGFDGELLAEYDASGPVASPKKEYGYRNGQLLITASPATSSSNSLSVNGSSAYVQVPNSSSLNVTGAITVEAWIKPNSIGAYQHIASRETYGVSGTGGGYELTLSNVGKARFDLYHSHNTYTPVIGSTTLTTGQWHHVAGVWDGSYLRIYVNGVQDGAITTGNGPASGTSNLKLGRNSGGGYFNGLIDEVRVSNTAVYTSNFMPRRICRLLPTPRDCGSLTDRLRRTSQLMPITGHCKAARRTRLMFPAVMEVEEAVSLPQRHYGWYQIILARRES